MLLLLLSIFCYTLAHSASPVFNFNTAYVASSKPNVSYYYLQTLNITYANGTATTRNMLHDGASNSPDSLSVTSMLVGGVMYTSWIKGNNPSTVYIGTPESPFAQENWQFSTVDKKFVWSVKRTYLQSVQIQGERIGLIWQCLTPGLSRQNKTGFAFQDPMKMSQIPSFADPTLFMNYTTYGGFPYNDRSSSYPWYEFLSQQTSQTFRLSPANFGLTVTISVCDSFGNCSIPGTGLFSFSKPPTDGTSDVVSFGIQTVDPRDLIPLQRDNGDQFTFTITLEFIEDPNTIAAPQTLNLQIPNSTLLNQIQQLVQVQNQFMGWVFGNNPASVPCLQEMWWFPTIQGIYTSDSASILLTQKQISMFASGGIKPDGNLYPRWYSGGFYDVEWGPFQDQVPHFILSVHASAISTGDKSWVMALMPAIDKVANYMVGRMNFKGNNNNHKNNNNNGATTGVYVCPGSGLADGNRHASNWYDIVEMGNLDALVNSYAIGALDALSDLKSFVGNSTGALYYENLYDTAVKQHNLYFWNDALGFYRDWIDIKGFKRNYFYTDHNFLAIIFGIATPTQATRIVNNVVEYTQDLCDQYGIPRSQMWAIPGNLVPIVNMKDLVSGTSGPFVGYENGGAFFHSMGYQILAYAIAGKQDMAYSAFTQFLNGISVNRAWAQQHYWNTDTLVGFDPLNNCLMSIWGILRAGFGVIPTLSRGLTISSAPMAEFEGASYTFSFLGQDVCIHIRNNTVVSCD